MAERARITCSPSLAKLALRMEGDTMISDLLKWSTRWVADTFTEAWAALRVKGLLLRRAATLVLA